DLLTGKVQRRREPSAHRDRPGSPHEILQKHHRREFQPRAQNHGYSLKRDEGSDPLSPTLAPAAYRPCISSLPRLRFPYLDVRTRSTRESDSSFPTSAITLVL